MIRKSGRSFLFLVLVALAPASVVRPQNETRDRSEPETAKQELQKKTLSVLDEVVSGGWSLKLPENRSYILANAADLLWPYDEKRARNLFWEALNNLSLPAYQPANQPVNSSAQTNGPTKEQLQDSNRYYAILNTRHQFLRKVAAHDPQLALDMLRATRQGPAPQVEGATRFDADADFEESLTYAAAASDPKRALQIARESLAKGLTYQILNLLGEVNQKDQDAGTSLAGEIISKLKTENLNSSNSLAPFIVMNLLELSRTAGSHIVLGSSQDPPSFTRLKLDENQKQDLIEVLTTAALEVHAAPNVLQTVRYVMADIKQFAPDRAARLEARLREVNRTSPNLGGWDTFDQTFEKATPEEILKAANKVSDDQRDVLFQQAASKAVTRGEADHYRELINSQIGNDAEKRVALDALDTAQMYYDIREGKTDDLEKLFPLIRAKEQRAMAMAQLAIMLQKKGEHDEAEKLLDDARSLVKVDLANQSQSDALLAVMLGYTQVDPPKAFAMIEPVVDRTNDEISKLLLVDKVAKSGFVKKGEIVINQPQIPLEYSMAKYAIGVAALGKADFDRTKALTDRFQRQELKVLARLLLAQALLRHSQTNQ